MLINSAKWGARSALLAGIAVAVSMAASSASAQSLKLGVQSLMPPVQSSSTPTIKSYFLNKKPKAPPAPDFASDTNGAAPVAFGQGSVAIAFEGISLYDTISFGRGFIPPDTMGAVGKTQYLEISNGAVAVYDKATGTQTSLVSDVAWWATAGQTGAQGDNRVMYNAAADRWIAVGFGANVADLQIAVSDTSDALGTWQSTKFTGFAGGTADYPTLALDKNAVYIGTNNFAPSFQGTTLNVIPLNSLFGAGAPTTNGLKQFNTPYNGTTQITDNGFAIQGVNSSSNSPNGKAIAASLFFEDNVVLDIANAGTPGSTLSAAQYTNAALYSSPLPGHQPAANNPANRQVLATLDERISSSVYEVKGRIYYVMSVEDPANPGYTSIRYNVLDAATNQLLDEGTIGGGNYDYFQGSLAVNSFGQVVIGFNRSGLQQTDANNDGLSDGNVSFLARTYYTDANGRLIQSGNELLLKVSLTDDYHNGSFFGQNAVGRQRWGDYSAVSLDPTNNGRFWAIGEFAREYNLPQFGHPGGTGRSRWGTYIAAIDFGGAQAVPEPAAWALMIMGFGLVGSQLRRRRFA